MENKQLWEEAKQVLVGGVNSPVRSFKAVGGNPVIIQKAEGPYIYTISGDKKIDFINNWGANILGHNHSVVLEAIHRTITKYISVGSTTIEEITLAKQIVGNYRSIDKIRFVNSGTEATMSAIRLARAYTGRNKIIKFEGCYHGHVDHLLAKGGSGLLTYSLPGSIGVPEDFTKHTIVLPYNDEESIQQIFESIGEEIAAVIVEPIAGNMGVIRANNSFLQLLRKLTHNYGSLLIFDEIITGYRVSLGGAQRKYDIEPDLTCLGKIIGGGFPIGAYGGRAEIMNMVSPEGPVYQAGTFAGNPVIMSSGNAVISFLNNNYQYYDFLFNMTEYIAKEIKSIFEHKGIPIVINYDTAMFSIFFVEQNKVTSFQDITEIHANLYKQLFWHLFQNNIYVPPSPYEAWFLTIQHQEKEIEQLLSSIKKFNPSYAEK